MSASAELASWLAARSPRERRLLAVAAACAGAIAIALVGQAARDDLATLRARVTAHEHELGDVRRLAVALRLQTPATAAVTVADAPLLGRLEEAAATTVGRDRIASMTPVAAPAGGRPDAVALRIADASLAEVVRLLHGLATGNPPLAVTRFELRKHPDDPMRFDASLDVAR